MTQISTAGIPSTGFAFSTDARGVAASNAMSNNSASSKTELDQSTVGFASALAAMLMPLSAPIPQEQTTNTEGLSELDASTSANANSAAQASSLAGTAPGENAVQSANSNIRLSATVAGLDIKSAQPAYAAATGARSVADKAPVTSPSNDVDALNPEFRTRLDRVISRMKDEFGHDVTIVEGYRPQARQNYLYEQGRTREGNIVTWTKASKHTSGLAVDVMIDGSYDNSAAYQTLQRVARQEGLRTLGARDPGHLELPSRATAAAWGESAALPRTDNISRATELAFNNASVTHTITSALDTKKDSDTSVADVATVATVAKVADVAVVAPVAPVAASSPTLSHTTPHVPLSSEVVSNMTATLATARVGQLLDARDASLARPMSHLTMNIDNGLGGSDQVRINLRDGVVNTHIALGDSVAADRLSLRTGALQQALEQQGLTADSVRITAAADTIARAVNTSNSDSGAGWTPRHGQHAHQEDGAGRDRQSAAHRESFRQDADDARQRARRAPRGEKET